MRTDSSVAYVDETNLKQIAESVEDPTMPPDCPDIQGEDCVVTEKSTSEATDNPTKPKPGNKSLPSPGLYLILNLLQVPCLTCNPLYKINFLVLKIPLFCERVL